MKTIMILACLTIASAVSFSANAASDQACSQQSPPVESGVKAALVSFLPSGESDYYGSPAAEAKSEVNKPGSANKSIKFANAASDPLCAETQGSNAWNASRVK